MKIFNIYLPDFGFFFSSLRLILFNLTFLLLLAAIYFAKDCQLICGKLFIYFFKHDTEGKAKSPVNVEESTTNYM